MKILMVAAENDALPGGKVGGIGDVVRDIPPALANAGQQVEVVIPGYQAFSRLPGSMYIRTLEVRFAGQVEAVEVYRVNGKNPQQNVTQWVLEHPLFAIGGVGQIYCDDAAGRPFATDASKFALFSAAVAKAIISGCFDAEGNEVDVIHLHDWHAATVAVLRAFDPEYRRLKLIRTVYTIHNLALQGIRPLADDESSLLSWFPDLMFNHEPLSDPRFNNCYNPMRAGINLSDKVHAVSPAYAQEILLPSHPAQGYFGGEGLQEDLKRAEHGGRLRGILNGCEYPQDDAPDAMPDNPPKIPLKQLFLSAENELLKWIGQQPTVQSAHLIAVRRLAQVTARYGAINDGAEQPVLITSVGRITDQKIRLLEQQMPNGQTALEQLLATLGGRGLFILLGSGDAQLEQFLTSVAAKHDNFIFLKGYSEALSANLYRNGDLFLMPSSFEPCGISQMLAMRAGQACLVHSVGGLRDTVEHHQNGFTFSGDNPEHQAENMIRCFDDALNTKQNNPEHWQEIAAQAEESRFYWGDVAGEYVQYLYG